MGYKKNAFHTHGNCHVDCLTHVVAAFHGPLKGKVHMLLQICGAVIAGGHQQKTAAVFHTLPHFHFYGFYERALTHGLHNSGGSQNRNTSLNTQPWVKGLLRRLLPVRNAYNDFQTTLMIIFRTDVLRCFQNHTAGYFVDCRTAHRLFQTFLCHASHAGAAVQNYFRFTGFLYPGKDLQTVCHIRVISRVLAHSAGHKILPLFDMQNLQIQQYSFWCHKGDVPDLLS